LNDTSDTFVKLFLLLDAPLVVFDIGCRGGFQEHWQRLGALAQLIGFDADAQEIQGLQKEIPNENFVPKVLGAKNGSGTLYLTQELACSSVYAPDEKLISQRPSLQVTNLISSRKVDVSTLDEWVAGKGFGAIDFIKLDVQGAELDVLQGAQKALGSVRMLEVEIEFNPIYQSMPLFGDVDRLLRGQGFSLWRLKNLTHYAMAENPAQNATEEVCRYDYHAVPFQGKNGQLYWADAFYVRDEIAYRAPRPWRLALKDACIASVLGFADLAASSLQDALQNCPAQAAPIIDAAIEHLSQNTDNNALPAAFERSEPLPEPDTAELAALRAERDWLAQQLNSIRQSHSYRLTAPYRRLADFMRGLIKK
jgi:FkbM family methyltransferase